MSWIERPDRREDAAANLVDPFLDLAFVSAFALFVAGAAVDSQSTRIRIWRVGIALNAFGTYTPGATTRRCALTSSPPSCGARTSIGLRGSSSNVWLRFRAARGDV